MAFSSIELALIGNTVGGYCREKTRLEYSDQINYTYSVDGHAVTIYENRPPWDGRGDWTRSGVARFKYNRTKNEWTLYWMRSDMKWHFYEPAESISNLNNLLDVVREDAHCCFLG